MSLMDESHELCCLKCNHTIKPVFPFWSDYLPDDFIECNHCHSVFSLDFDNSKNAVLVYFQADR